MNKTTMREINKLLEASVMKEDVNLFTKILETKFFKNLKKEDLSLKINFKEKEEKTHRISDINYINIYITDIQELLNNNIYEFPYLCSLIGSFNLNNENNKIYFKSDFVTFLGDGIFIKEFIPLEIKKTIEKFENYCVELLNQGSIIDEKSLINYFNYHC